MEAVGGILLGIAVTWALVVLLDASSTRAARDPRRPDSAYQRMMNSYSRGGGGTQFSGKPDVAQRRQERNEQRSKAWQSDG